MSETLFHVDTGFLKKFDRPGPRYTSYPTAPLFSDSFTAGDYREEIERTNKSGARGDISLYAHFPFCDTLCYFCGCTMLVTRDQGRVREYLKYLKKEIDHVAGLLSPERRVTQLHWGGGTPTHLQPDDMADIAAYTRSALRFGDDIEASVEIDPRELTRRHLEVLRESGFNRVSLGVQDFDEKVQKAVNRVQPRAVTLTVFDWIRQIGFEGVNVDLIYGLPFQTIGTFRSTLEETVTLDPNRIAVFNYAHVPWLKPHQKLIREEDLPTAEQKLEILKMTIEYLTSVGYEYIGMDHFAKPDDELSVARRQKTLYRNFQGYSTRAGADLYGLGVSSISHFGDIYAQNAKTLPEYFAALDAGELPTHSGYRMNDDDHIRKYVIMRLMCDLEVDKGEVNRRFGIDFDRYFSSSVAKLVPFLDEGIIEADEDKILIDRPGRLILRNIAMCFDAYLDSMEKGKPIFSRTV